jgi:dihydrofolate reductase
MAIIGIVAISENFAIGKDGKLPWHYPTDLKFFKDTTVNNAVVMGFNTWKSIGKALPKRLSIVLSRSHSLENQPNVLLLRSKEELIALSKYLNCDLFIIGGAKTYVELSGIIDKWIVTDIPQIIGDADTFMPEDFLELFEHSDSKLLDKDLLVKFYTRKS